MKTTLNIIIFTILCFLQISTVSANSNRWEGLPFPTFELKNQNNQVSKNQDFAEKWVVYYFYPKDKTPGCTEEAKNFVQDSAEYSSRNTAIVGISYDDVESHKDFAETYELKYTLLADVDKKLAKALDVDRILPWPHASRQTFLVNPKGVIVKHYEEVDPSVHSAELLRDLAAFQ